MLNHSGPFRVLHLAIWHGEYEGRFLHYTPGVKKIVTHNLM